MNECGIYPTPAGGLTARAVAESRRRKDWNQLSRTRRASAAKILLRQFSVTLILSLALAAVIALSLGLQVSAVCRTPFLTSLKTVPSGASGRQRSRRWLRDC